MKDNRREFIKRAGKYTASGIFLGSSLTLLNACGAGQGTAKEGADDVETKSIATTPFFKISLAQWSLHNSFFSGKLDNLDFAAKAKNDFGIEAVEYVNQFFADKAKDQEYLAEMKKRAADLGVTNVLIMIDREGHLGSTNDDERKQAVENHYKWVEAAKFLGCHSIRVNAAGEGTAEEVAAAAVDGLGSLAEFAKDHNINIIVENHGGYSSNGQWLSGVLSQVNMENAGSLPDFGNFCIKNESQMVDGKETWACVEEYDRYKGVKELMPFAKGVSAKTHNFNEAGIEVETDYKKMLQIVKDAGYTGYVGVEYEGQVLSEDEGIKATKKLLETVGTELNATA
ncbi:MAG: xylose isomerase [Thalassobius sp.]|nr:xylose isomerase [Thalassovita sp.]